MALTLLGDPLGLASGMISSPQSLLRTFYSDSKDKKASVAIKDLHFLDKADVAHMQAEVEPLIVQEAKIMRKLGVEQVLWMTPTLQG